MVGTITSLCPPTKRRWCGAYCFSADHVGISISIISHSDFIWPFLPPYMGVIPNQKMAFIFPISCILVFIFPIFMIYFHKCEGKGSFQKSQIKSLSQVRVDFNQICLDITGA